MNKKMICFHKKFYYKILVPSNEWDLCKGCHFTFHHPCPVLDVDIKTCVKFNRDAENDHFILLTKDELNKLT